MKLDWRSSVLYPVAQSYGALAHLPREVGCRNNTIVNRAEGRIHTERAVGGVNFIVKDCGRSHLMRIDDMRSGDWWTNMGDGVS
jgi:hypothetical protein